MESNVRMKWNKYDEEQENLERFIRNNQYKHEVNAKKS